MTSTCFLCGAGPTSCKHRVVEDYVPLSDRTDAEWVDGRSLNGATRGRSVKQVKAAGGGRYNLRRVTKHRV